MNESARERTQRYITARSQHATWLLLASRRAPLVLGCLHSLFEYAHDGIPMEDALGSLAEMLAIHANDDGFEIDVDNTAQLAGRELRAWIKRRLVIEREGRLFATDALETALRFADRLDNRIMTSTASRLSVVQREIEDLESGLNPNAKARIEALRRKIQQLELELEEAEAGKVEVLSDAQAIEGMREIYALATGLRADFRRVEDSWRKADRRLRESIISERYHRGDIVDRLLDGHDSLLQTPEGRVFDSFQQQLRQSFELENMKVRLRTILSNPIISKALSWDQRVELRWLVMRLVKESIMVSKTRSRSERDVKGFLKTGLAAEHHRVGNLLSDIFNQALKVDWQSQAVRRQGTPLPPVGVALAGLPMVARLRFKSMEDKADAELDLQNKRATLESMDGDFWAAFDGLDRDALVAQTLALLAKEKRAMSLSELAQRLPPTHDLETFALWLGMAQEAGIPIDNENTETIELSDEQQQQWCFSVPKAQLDSDALKNIEWEL